MNPQQYLKRFEKRFGAVTLSTSGLPVAIGSEYRQFGISFRPQESIKGMFNYYLNKNLPMPEVEIVRAWDALPSIEYKAQRKEDVCIVSFSTPNLESAMRVLENNPFEHTTLLKTNGVLPVVLQRDGVAVFVAPGVWTINPNNNYPVPDDKNVYKTLQTTDDSVIWISPIYNTPFWNAEYNNSLGEKIIKCRSCGFTLGIQDYIKRVLDNHPDCHCVCHCEKCKEIRSHFQRIQNMEWYERRKWE